MPQMAANKSLNHIGRLLWKNAQRLSRRIWYPNIEVGSWLKAGGFPSW